eukprot:COSAG01_NODE_418_length_17279_cov_69.506228_7_plen_87_part_00
MAGWLAGWLAGSVWCCLAWLAGMPCRHSFELKRASLLSTSADAIERERATAQEAAQQAAEAREQLARLQVRPGCLRFRLAERSTYY